MPSSNTNQNVLNAGELGIDPEKFRQTATQRVIRQTELMAGDRKRMIIHGVEYRGEWCDR